MWDTTEKLKFLCLNQCRKPLIRRIFASNNCQIRLFVIFTLKKLYLPNDMSNKLFSYLTLGITREIFQFRLFNVFVYGLTSTASNGKVLFD